MKKHPFKKRVGTQTKTNSKPAPKEEKELNRASSLASIESYQEFVPKGPITIPTIPKEEQEDRLIAMISRVPYEEIRNDPENETFLVTDIKFTPDGSHVIVSDKGGRVITFRQKRKKSKIRILL